ncbi:MAG: glycosyltransferase family protein [Dissulfuribacterales bacterium]
MKIVATIEARMSSSRLPGKVLLPVSAFCQSTQRMEARASLDLMCERVSRSKYVQKIIVATTTKPADDAICELCERIGVRFFRGSEENVLQRVLSAVTEANADLICKLTGDCPLIDPLVIDRTIISHLAGDYDYTSTCLWNRTFPIGIEVEVLWRDALAKTAQLTNDPIDQVHVTYFIYKNPHVFKLNSVTALPSEFAPDLRITMDTQEDYEVIKMIYERLYGVNPYFTTKDVILLMRAEPSIAMINRDIRQKHASEG